MVPGQRAVGVVWAECFPSLPPALRCRCNRMEVNTEGRLERNTREKAFHRRMAAMSSLENGPGVAHSPVVPSESNRNNTAAGLQITHPRWSYKKKSLQGPISLCLSPGLLAPSEAGCCTVRIPVERPICPGTQARGEQSERNWGLLPPPTWVMLEEDAPLTSSDKTVTPANSPTATSCRTLTQKPPVKPILNSWPTETTGY